MNLCIVDDSSPDGTGQIADTYARRHPKRISVIHRSGKLGLGTAYITGFRFALENGAEIIGQMDSDFSHPIKKIPDLINTLNIADVALGSRYVLGGSTDLRWPKWRKWLSSFGNSYARKILRLPIKDVTGGFRFWKRSAIESILERDIQSSGYAFQIETVFLAYKLGYLLKEIPIYFSDRRWGTSKMDFRIQIEASYRVWQILLRYRNLSINNRNNVV